MEDENRVDTHNMKCDFGRHRGELYTRMPVPYLKWMVNEKHSRAHIAEAELARRGTTTPEFEVSGHAIDRASLCCLGIWQRTRRKDEGLNSWLCRMGKNALQKKQDSKGRHPYNDMLFAFEMDGVWPVLKTVMRERKQNALR